VRVTVLTRARFPFKEGRVLCETLLARVRGGKVGAKLEVRKGGGKGAAKGKAGGGGEIWLLDERGDEWSSERWASELGAAADRGAGEIQLWVGDAYGASARLAESAKRRLSLGPCTLPSWLACVVVCEQVYRADTIMRGTPYHHG
jgi:23S rRNA (pseudouridine1915-N3)-methyltransferase